VFSWGPRKATANVKKHGVPFEEAATAFGDSETLDWDDFEHSAAERSVRLGFSTAGFYLWSTPIRRLKYGKETIRIINARHATRKERQAYAG
jgi:uncharacterized DUF497 family protein